MRVYMNALANPWRVFDELANDLPYDFIGNPWHGGGAQFPRVNVWENDKGMKLAAEVPGATADQLDVSVDANVLTLKGDWKRPDGNAVSFQRSFNLPFELDGAQVRASLKNGVLSLDIPRKAAAERKRIAITAA